MTQHTEGLIGLLDYMRKQQDDYLALLPEAERVADGTWEVWAPKDVLSHLYFWQNNLVNILNNLDQTPPEEEPFEVRNNRNYLRFQHEPYDTVYGVYRKSLDEIVERIKTYSDEDLTAEKRFPRIPNGTLQSSILGNTYTHNVTHLGELVSRRGTSADGLALQEAATQKLIGFDNSPQSTGTALYNLACAYALVGNSPRTVELLREALKLRPALIEFSKEDTDFNLVKDAPEFQAIYGKEAAAA